MTEVLFYHLTEHKLEQALPGLLERSLERGWRAVVQTGTEVKRDALNEHLWTYVPESFLPHGSEASAPDNAAEHPVWLTTGHDNPNTANIRFIADGAVASGTEVYERVIYMFDGMDEDAVAGARERWKIEKAAGHDLTYWQQTEEGRWVKKA